MGFGPKMLSGGKFSQMAPWFERICENITSIFKSGKINQKRNVFDNVMIWNFKLVNLHGRVFFRIYDDETNTIKLINSNFPDHVEECFIEQYIYTSRSAWQKLNFKFTMLTEEEMAAEMFLLKL